MILDFSNDEFSLKSISLKSNQISQLQNWGFKRDFENNLFYAGRSPDKVLIKVVNYFKKENIDFEPTEDCKTKIEIITTKTKLYEEIKNLGNNFKQGEYDRNSFNVFKSFLKSEIPRKLKNHQVKAAFHLYTIHNGANFSVPGSGKTTVVLSVYEKLRVEGKVNVLFVVGPPACFGPWKKEFIDTLGRIPKKVILAGGDKKTRKSEYFVNKNNKAELYLTTFHTLLKDQQEINTLFCQNGINVFLVIDEAHYIKRLNGNWASAVLNIAKHSKFRCILTGTPAPQGLSDLFNLFDFLWPENDPIETNSKVKLQTFEKENKISDAQEILDDRIGPLFYRVRKKELGLLKPKFHEPIMLPMNKYEQVVYDAVEKKIKSYSLSDYLQNIDFVNKLKRGRMIRLRQCVSYLHLLNKVIENYDENFITSDKDLRYIIKDYDNIETPAKFQYLNKMLKKLQLKKQKVVIWTNFIGTINKLKKFIIHNMGLNSECIYGQTPIEQTSISDEKTREDIRDEFVDPNSGLDILIANPAACGESISLHKTCHHAIYYDLTYNCAQYLQSLDRIHRVGGSEDIEANYYFLQYINTIDQDILNSVRKKEEKMKRIIDNDYKIYELDMFNDDDEINAYDRLFKKS